VARPIVFLSDFGLDDEFVGICHGVIASISPGSRIIDLTHSVAPGAVGRAALLLAEATPYMPSDAVYLAVVDPGVGTARLPLVVVTGEGQAMVGPDNGVLSLAWDRLGGASAAVRIAGTDLVPWPASRTFHGRDLFAPAAAHLAGGGGWEALGPPVDLASLVRLREPEPAVGPGRIECEVLDVDRFGNVQLGVRPAHLAAAGLDRVDRLAVELPAGRAEGTIRSRSAGRAEAVRASTFGDVPPGALAALLDSRGWLALAVNGGQAAAELGLEPGDRVGIVPATGGAAGPGPSADGGGAPGPVG
jgi:S-adenosyl-L-methionine hydrolase (adenosine-forming)